MTDLVSTRPAVFARAHAGHWIADCPRCGYAVGGRLLPFGSPVFDCQDCGLGVEVRWPSEQMRRGVERLLMMRPVPHTRNWFPHESLSDLLAENVEHGIGPSQPGEEIRILGERIELDTLPRPVKRLQIGG